jgi:hypothetical protein
MGSSRIQYRTRLYRKAVLRVIFAVIVALLPAFAQYAKKRQVSKGPRAVGLVELAENGKAHLIPITIMIDGKFYDAGAYKADPVPMALQYGTVYEAVQSGASQGLFTISGALPGKDSWVADGKWRSQADIDTEKAREKARREKLAQKAPEEVGGPPRLRRAPNSEGDSSSAPAQTGQSAPSQKPSSGGGSSSPNPPAAQNPSSSSNSSKSADASSGSSASLDAPDRPVLRHQAPSDIPHEQTKAGADTEPLKGPIQLIPAVSDAGGPEFRPYTYQLKPEEQQNFLKKMLALASDDVQARAAHLQAESEPVANNEPKAGTKTTAKTGIKTGAKATKPARSAPAPEFQNVQLKVFDLTNSNEPVLVLTATASIPNSKLNLHYTTALVAREDIYGDLHKVFAQTTDDQHLDVLPKYEFIDAVDVDGDGRGELLFRTTSDSGTAFNIYAVIGDRLWPLFEGRPGA